MTQTQGNQQLGNIFTAIEQRLTALNAVLEREHQALQDNDLEAIQQCNGEKADHLTALDGLEKQQTAILTKAGLANDKAALQAYIEQTAAGDQAHLDAQWQRITEGLAHCEKQNLINGQIMAAHRRRTERILEILRGQDQQAAVYGADGATHSGGQGNPLASA